jgi:hypothetical protein
VFIEFSNEIMNCVTMHEQAEFNNSSYTLQGLVRCYQRHFTCAIKIEDKWIYFDDMCSTVQEFTLLHRLKQHYPVGWFFTIFQLSDENNINPSRPYCNLQSDTILSPTLKRKQNHDDISCYPQKQSKVDEQNPCAKNVKKSPKQCT